MKNAILACALLIGLFANAQKDSLTARNTIYLEAGGNSLVFALNYDRTFRINKYSFSFSAGLFLHPRRITGRPINYFQLMHLACIPLQLNFLYGKSNQFESGIGIFITNGDNYNIDEFTNLVDVNNDFIGMIKILGYRIQKRNGGFFGRINVNFMFPLFSTNKSGVFIERIGFWPGASIGYIFKPRKR